MPTSIPIMRATTTSADAEPVHLLAHRDEHRGVDRSDRQAEAEPAAEQHRVAWDAAIRARSGSARVVAVHEVITANAAAVITIPAAAIDPVAGALREPSAEHRADRHPTRRRRSTSAAPSCEFGNTVARASTGTSSSAAMSAAPTARLVSSAP